MFQFFAVFSRTLMGYSIIEVIGLLLDLRSLRSSLLLLFIQIASVGYFVLLLALYISNE